MKRPTAKVADRLAPVRGCPVCSLAQRLCRTHTLEAEERAIQETRRALRRARAAVAREVSR